MQYTYLGRSGLKVSRLCLGTMNFGVATDEKESFRIMDAALDAGINFFDTANVYGGPEHKGRTEEIIGKWFAQGGNRREKVVLATKFYGDMLNPIDGPNQQGGLSAYKLKRHLEGSLRRLQTDHIELYQMHHVDRQVSFDEIWEAYKIAQYEGKIGYAGSSNFAGFDLVTAQYEAKKKGLLGLISEQHKYSLLCRLPELEVLPAAQQEGIGIIPWSPLAGGLLSGHAQKQIEGSRSAKLSHEVEKYLPQLSKFADLAQSVNLSEATIALAWTLANPVVTAPIIGPRTLEQLTSALEAVEVNLSQEVLTQLDNIFPGPGAAAPKAYAW